ncbi:MAG: glutamate racemase [Fibrobacter sp.]|nr:glutamate racemase [Fibrobacter sp.]
MSDFRPIGVIDSGMGGLTVVKELSRLLPREQIIYLGDTARGPYGDRSEEIITQFALQSADVLLNFDVKLLVVACHTASSVALELISKKAKDIPVIGGVLPGARAAVLRTAERKIGVIGTNATIRSLAYTRAIQSIDPEVKVFGKACPLFVPLVNEGMVDHDMAQVVAQHYLYEMIDRGVDCIILGCTHYSLLIETIQGTVGTRIQLLDSALWTAKEAQDILMALNALTNRTDTGLQSSRFLVTDLVPDLYEQASFFLGSSVSHFEKITF